MPARLALPVAALAVAACAHAAPAARPAAPAQAAPAQGAATAADARAFVAAANDELKRLYVRASTAEWIKATHITDDTERNAASMQEDLMAYLSKIIPEAARFDGVAADPDTTRMLHLLSADRGGLRHDPPRARPQLLPARLRGPALPLPGQRQRRLPRGARRHDLAALDDPGLPRGGRPRRPGAERRARRAEPPDEERARGRRLPALRAPHGAYQYQFHEALCRAAGWKGPLHACSIYGSKEAGKRLQAMMAMGASRPWPDAMAALTGQREADATALLDYYAPLRAWLRKQNAGRTCGW